MRPAKQSARSKKTRRLDSRPEQVVEINGNPFVANLFWLALSSVQRYMSEARKFGDEHDFDIVAIRKGKRIQAGFVSRDSGVVKGMYSLAASLVAALGDDWCGAFALNDGRYAVVVAHQGQIAPGFDLIANEEEAREKLQEAIGTFRFPVESIYAPEKFEISPHSKDVYTLLQPKALRKELRLKPLRFGLTQREVVIAAAGVLLVVGAGAGLFSWRAYQANVFAEQANAAQQAQLAALQKINETARKKLLLEALAHPWAKQANPIDFIRVCAASTGSLPLSITGWIFDSAVCTGDSVAATYTRQDGRTDNQFETAVSQSFGARTSFDPTGDKGTFTVPHSMPAGGDDTLPVVTRTVGDFRSHIQALDYGLSPTITETPVVLSMPTQPGAPPPNPSDKPPEADWRQLHFALPKSTLPPYEILKTYSHFNGVRFESITTTLDAGKAELTWNLEGNLYAKK